MKLDNLKIDYKQMIQLGIVDNHVGFNLTTNLSLNIRL